MWLLLMGNTPLSKHFCLVEMKKGIVISDQFLSDPLKCLRLFHCIHEVGNTKLCKAIENAKALNHKNKKIIDLSDVRFSPNELECVTLFLTSSSCKEWVGINFYCCYIQDQGIRILHRRLHNSGISIDRLWLDCNGLTSSSFSLITDIVLSCKVKILWIDSNNMVEGVEDFHSMLSEHSTLEKLHITDTNLSSETTIKIFSALLAKSNLRKLWITSINISDEASQSIAVALKSNTTLTKLKMGTNPISGDSALLILDALQDNKTLIELGLPEYSEEIKAAIISKRDKILEMRKAMGVI